MSPERWAKIEEAFEAAAARPADDRPSFLRERYADDAELIREVENLLKAEADAGGFIESNIWTDSAFLSTSAKKELSRSLRTSEIDSDEMIGQQIGVFKIVRELGRGGMGAVYMAERADGEFRQVVAIKFIRRGMDMAFIVRRFRHERQILASFEHPNIARLLDGGTTEDGIPYFVMEYIEGDTILNYSDKNRLDTRARLKIFQRVCSALDYAHDRQIIHRDIKPGNILINRSGEPKLLDFGIAKIMDPDLVHESVNPTGSMVRMMTADYASPEQVTGAEIGAASDVYSMGVLLYELVSGHRPYELAGKPIHEVSRIVCDEIPPLPSTVLASSAGLLSVYENDPTKLFETRSCSAGELRQLLSSGLDNIVSKALAKDPRDRYPAARELSEDIRRFLSGARVEAPKQISRYEAEQSLPPRPKNSIAVLPFKYFDLSGADTDPDGSFLGLGIADALIGRLSKIKRLLVRPTNSIKVFGDQDIDPIAAGQELRVDQIIAGTIKRANDRLRVNIQLLDVRENSAVWATSVDETFSDVLSLEVSLANRLIEAVLPQLTGSELAEFAKRGTSIPEAFEQYLRGRYQFNTFTEEGFAKAFVCFHEAIAADPDYALAYCGIADYYNWLGIVGVLPPQECFLPAIEAATKALEIDPELSEAHATLGFSLHAGRYDWSRAETHLRKAIELNPGNALAYVWYSIVLCTEGRFVESIENAELGVELDPLTPFHRHNVGWVMYYARQYNEAAERYERMIEDFPNYGFGYYGLSKVQRKLGKSEDAIQNARKAADVMHQSIFARLAEAESLAAAGIEADARKILNETRILATERYVSPYQTALVQIYLGDSESAVTSVVEAHSIKEAWLNWLNVDPAFDPIRSDPRITEVLSEIGYLKLLPVGYDTQRPQGSPIRPITADVGTPSGALGERPTLLIGDQPITSSILIPVTRHNRRFIFGSALLVFIIAAFGIYFYKDQIIPVNPTASTPAVFKNPSLLILPFSSEDPDTESIGIGLAEALSQRLGYVKGLRVVSPNTGRLAAKNGIASLASDAGVMYVLRGNISKTEAGTTFNGELIDVGSSTPIWSGSASAPIGDYFTLQSRITDDLLKTLQIEPLLVERKQLQKGYTQNFRVYEKYLIGRSQMAKRDEESLYRAVDSFSAAISEDDQFALGYVGLADSYALLKLYDITPPFDAYEKALSYAESALKIDDDLAEAHASLGYIEFFYKRDRKAAELEFRRATQMNPSYAQAHHWFALALSAMNRPVDALSEIETARRLDPRSLAIRAAAGIVYFHAGDFTNALKECDQALAVDPTFVPALKVKRWVYSAMGDFRSARETLEKERLNSGGGPDYAGWQIIEAQTFDPADSNNGLALLQKAIQSPEIVSNDFAYAFEIALAFHHLKEKEKALAWLERSEAAGSHSFNMLEADPRLNDLHEDPRFIALAEKLRTER